MNKHTAVTLGIISALVAGGVAVQALISAHAAVAACELAFCIQFGKALIDVFSPSPSQRQEPKPTPAPEPDATAAEPPSPPAPGQGGPS